MPAKMFVRHSYLVEIFYDDNSYRKVWFNDPECMNRWLASCGKYIDGILVYDCKLKKRAYVEKL